MIVPIEINKHPDIELAFKIDTHEFDKLIIKFIADLLKKIVNNGEALSDD